jgi:predicted nucleotidyltransferase
MKRELNKRLRTIGNKIKQEYRAERVILFGSYARGDATEDSDVDLLVVAPTKERFFVRMATVRRLIRDLRNGLPVSPIVLTPAELEKRRQAGDPFVREILETGVPL